MKKNIFILLSLINFSFTQVSIESIPRSLLLDNNLVPEEIILPQINLEQLMEEDILERKSGITKPYRFAKTIEVDLNMTNSGTWSILEDGSAIWQLKIRSANAYSLNLDNTDMNHKKTQTLCKWKCLGLHAYDVV